MEDIPQPASEPYETGDTVQVYLSPDDGDSTLHGVNVEIIDVLADDLHRETGRELDRYSYRVRRVDSNTVLDVEFRHRDLVPSTPAE